MNWKFWEKKEPTQDVLVGYMDFNIGYMSRGRKICFDVPHRPSGGMYLLWYEAEVSGVVYRAQPNQCVILKKSGMVETIRGIYVPKYPDVQRGVQLQPDGTETELVWEKR
jgi:hypothetical protein